MKNPWIIIGVIIVLLFGGAVWYSGASDEQNNEGVELLQHIKGNKEATVSLVEYSDFQCPACAAFQPVLEEVMNEYADKISFEYKHFPLPIHPYSQSAAVAAEAAGLQGKFFEYHDLLFKNQQTWASAATPNVLFIQYAEELGLDIETFRRQMNSSILRDHVRQSLLEAKNLNITGTPTFFLNGEKMQFQTFQEFIEKIAFAVDPTAMASSTANTEGKSGVRFGL